MRKTTVGSVLLASLAALLALAGNAAARGGMPEPETGRGQIIESIYYQIYVAGVIAFLLVMALLLWVIFRYRASSGVGRATFEKERENLKLEMTWIVIPLGVVLWVGGISYSGLVDLDEGVAVEDAFTEIRIVGSQWNWEADYGQGVSVFADPAPGTGEVADGNVFLVPANVPVLFNVTAIDVIHSFAIQEVDEETGRLGAQIGMVDANPTGPHKYNHMVVTFETGEYYVQCKEMCFNPGHAYMRARIVAVPVGEYDDWLEQKQLEAGADLVERLGLEIGDGTLTTEREDIAVANGARLIVQVLNGGSGASTVSVSGTDATVTVDPGAMGTLVYDTTEAGTFSFEASTGGSVPFEVIDATPVSFDLGDFFFDPEELSLEGGQTYLFQVRNVGETIHNMFIGDFESASEQEVFWNSITIGPGNTASFIVTPESGVSFDTWCNVPGHYELGMFGVLNVT